MKKYIKKYIKPILAVIVVAALVYSFLVHRALDQAQAYESSGGTEMRLCGGSLTLARHNVTRVTYLFYSTCIPDGWSNVD